MSKKLVALLIFGVAFTLYWGTAWFFNATATPSVAYFDHLADAFLHGRLDLVAPPDTHDLTHHAGRWYVPFPPLPALLLLPWVAVTGVASVQTVLFAALLGGSNVALLYLLLVALSDRGWSQLATADHLWLTLLFGCGSVHWYMATLGSVWFVGQLCTVTFVILALWLAVRGRSPWLAGAALALALLARPNVIFTWVLVVGIGLTISQQEQGRSPSPLVWRWAVASAIPLGLAVAGLLLYNQARFGAPLDFGYLTENVADKLAPDLQRYGQFHWHYLRKNLWAMGLAGPLWNAERNTWEPDPEGMSLLLTTPALIYLGRAWCREAWVIASWVAVALLLMPLLLYYNTGWWQFGYRFSLDFMPPVLMLLAVAAGKAVSVRMRFLILLGGVVNLYGVVWWHG